MEQFLVIFVLVPFASFLLSLLLSGKRERILANMGTFVAAGHFVAAAVFCVTWLIQGSSSLHIKQWVLYQSHGYAFHIDFHFDRYTAVFLLVGSFITILVNQFSKTYMHREAGYKRYFATLLLFFAGYNFSIFSGNLETFFLGWELLGITSFLLIGFYRDRYLPVKNAYKVISLYRLGDICLLLAMWLIHHLYHRIVSFSELNLDAGRAEFLEQHFVPVLLISAFIVIAACVKSALFPFSSWLPRAMEGPTSSSAIFYGSLSAHLGIFLLLRTYSFWESIEVVDISISILGIVTALVANCIARVQSGIKAQIAYASIAQIGLMTFEVAMGWHTLALLHFVGNAFLRTYQLLVSPSMLSYRIHGLLFQFKKQEYVPSTSFVGRVRNTLYVLGLREWKMDAMQFSFLWSPLKWVGEKLLALLGEWTLASFTGLLILGFILNGLEQQLPPALVSTFPYLFIVASLAATLCGFASRQSALKTWFIVCIAQVLMLLAIALNKDISETDLSLYLVGFLPGTLLGYICLLLTLRRDNDIDLSRYHGYVYETPWTAAIFLLSILAVACFPISTAFIGIDILFTYIHSSQWLLISLAILTFAMTELALLRIYCRIYLGQHKKQNHPMAYRSS